VASTLAPSPVPTTARHPTTAERVGFAIAIVVNGVMLWVAHQLLDWQWPGFLTDDFERVLWLLSASFVAGMVVNAALMVRNRGRFRAFADLVTASFGIAVGVRTWTVFPFDFSGYATDWSWLARTVVIAGIIATSIAALVNLVRLVLPGAPEG
jgi:hypothetical protein